MHGHTCSPSVAGGREEYIVVPLDGVDGVHFPQSGRDVREQVLHGAKCRLDRRTLHVLRGFCRSLHFCGTFGSCLLELLLHLR